MHDKIKEGKSNLWSLERIPERKMNAKNKICKRKEKKSFAHKRDPSATINVFLQRRVVAVMATNHRIYHNLLP